MFLFNARERENMENMNYFIKNFKSEYMTDGDVVWRGKGREGSVMGKCGKRKKEVF
jgi:hypothetical protein